jgi:ubiquinone biosynthesis protein UbiJ
MRNAESSMPPWFRDALSELVELLADVALRTDPVACARLRRLAGRSILVRVAGVGQHFTLRFTEDGLRVDSIAPPAPSVTITGDPLTLLALLWGSRSARGRIDGDESVLQEFNAILRSLRPDPSAALARLTGAGTADALADALDVGVAAVRTLADGVLEASGQMFRQHGRQYFLDRADHERFLERAYRLRLDMDRLEARIALLSTHRRADRAPQ